MARDRLSESIRIVVIESDPGTRETIKQHAAAAGYELVKESGDANDCERIVAEARPDLVFLTVGSEAAVTLERIRRIREHHVSTAIVLVSDEASPQLILNAMRAGAHEFLTRPLDAGELEGALSRLERQRGPAAASRSGGRIWATYATKGGVGGSSLATNLALALQKHLKTRTALVDFNMQVGDLALMLDATGGHSFAHAVGDGDIDQVKLRTMLSPHPSGLSLLTMADRPEESNLVKRRHVSTLLTLLREMFEYVVVDLGRHIDERSIELLDHSDLIVLVTALDVPTIRNTSSYLDLLRRLEIPTERVRLVVNRLEEGRRITNRDLTRAVGQDIFFAIPNDYTVMSAAIDSGSPVVVNAPRSKLAESYAGLARALAESCPRSRSMSETESREVS